MKSQPRILTHEELLKAAQKVAESLLRHCDAVAGGKLHIHPIPRGGVSAFYLVLAAFNSIPFVHGSTYALVNEPDPTLADVFLDDLVDSGKTAQRYREINPSAHFEALIHKTPDGGSGYRLGEWLVFPWEQNEAKSSEDIFTRLLQFIGENPERGGLVETPARMAKAWKFWTGGYHLDPTKILKAFEDGGETYDELVLVKGIPFYSQCEHHLAPFFGTVDFGYIPQKRVVGLSKMNRLVDAFARRLQVQERMTAQIIDSFCAIIQPVGAGIRVTARHMCMESRGVQHSGCGTTTTSFRGVLKDGPNHIAARAEFLTLCTR